MEELLRQILEELRADDSPAWWLEVLRTVGPLVGGALVAAIGFFAVHQQNVTQRDNLKQTIAAQAVHRRAERLTAWRRERYGELLAAFGEYHASVRRMNLALNLPVLDPAAQERLRDSLEHFMSVNSSSRILQASMQVADKEVAELAQKLADEYYNASRQLVAMGITAQLPRDEKALDEAQSAVQKQIDESSERRYGLNRRIERLISEGESCGNELAG
ncbi:MAG: hypothetical protein IIC90_04790 [Chloroflexi bacterium]|nr:hypothetical protein [Chloroflexota bacterium]